MSADLATNAAPIFIGGMMKSGTSLLRKLLGRHSRLFAGLETHWFSDEFEAGFRDGSGKRQQWLLEFFDVQEAEIAALRTAAKSSADFFDQFMNHCTQRASKARWIEKTPDNVLHTDRIWRHWPNAIVLVLQRDPKDVYASWKKNNKLSLDEFLHQLQRLDGNLANIRGRETQLLEVNYAKLVREPVACLKTVCEFIDEAFEPQLAEYEGDEQDYQKVLDVTGTQSATAQSLAKPIFTSSLDQWKEILTPEEVERIGALERQLASD